MDSAVLHLSVLRSRRIFDPLKGPTCFRRDEFTREAVCEFRVEEEPVHYPSVVVLGKVVPQFDPRNAGCPLSRDNVVRQVLKTSKPLSQATSTLAFIEVTMLVVAMARFISTGFPPVSCRSLATTPLMSDRLITMSAMPVYVQSNEVCEA